MELTEKDQLLRKIAKLEREYLKKGLYNDITTFENSLKDNKPTERAGLRDFTLEEIGKYLGVTRERVRQIEAIAMKKIKHHQCQHNRRLSTYMETECRYPLDNELNTIMKQPWKDFARNERLFRQTNTFR